MNLAADDRPTPSDPRRSRVRIEFRPTGSGVEVIDSTDRRRYSLATSGPVEPRPTGTDGFLFPVDDARRISTDELTLPTVVAVLVRDSDGELLARTEHFAWEELPEGRYQLELSAPIKIHLAVETALTITADAQQTRITFENETDVEIGVQSKHEQPIATVTTSPEPRSMMEAISTFGSALKTTSPERSYPTFRGHPPAIELGDSLRIPNGIRAPDTGIRLELPEEYRYCYVGSSLAYYLAARMEPGPTPKLVTDHGFEYPLGTGRGFEQSVERVLKQTFLLDCVTRTEGLYRLSLHERDQVERLIDHDLADLYGMPIARRIEEYLSVDFDAIESHVPEWKLTTHVSPVASSIETLPYIVNDLAVIRTPQWTKVTESEVVEAAVGSFLRDSFLRSTAAQSTNPSSFVELETANSIEHAWVGEETPIGVSEATAEAYHNRFERRPSSGSIEITVVCNDPEMDEERGLVDQAYGSRLELPFDVEVLRGLTREELRAQLETQTDLLHYIGHIDDDGFKCDDGMLDAETLDDVGVDAFVLNACQSYDQGMHLIHNGAIGGIATLSTVINSGAVRIGSAVARLLNCGFPLRAALEIAKDESIIGGSYIVIGDGGLTIAQPESGTPYLCEIDAIDEECEVTIRTYPTTAGGMGGVFMPIIHSNDEYYLNSGDINTFRLPRAELEAFLCLEDVPIKYDGELHWSRSFDVNDL